MKNASKVTTSFLLIAVLLTSCNSFLPTRQTPPTQAIETALVIVGTEMAETQAGIPTATSIVTPLPTYSPLSPTETPIPTSALSFSGTPTVVPLSNGLTWSECVVPIDDYARTDSDMEFLAKCIEFPTRNEDDEKRRGEFVDHQNATNDWRISIGSDHFETRINDISQGCCSYKLVKNGDIILEMFPGFMTSNPNRGFWNIGGKLVWELAGYIHVIVVDGVDYNEKYQLEGSHFPYEIKEKLIYIAKKNGKFHIVYDEKRIGPEFDAISMAYCCGMISVYYGSGQYWFVGRRGGTMYVVSIQ
jgi:hypothetical protein